MWNNSFYVSLTKYLWPIFGNFTSLDFKKNIFSEKTLISNSQGYQYQSLSFYFKIGIIHPRVLQNQFLKYHLEVMIVCKKFAKFEYFGWFRSGIIRIGIFHLSINKNVFILNYSILCMCIDDAPLVILKPDQKKLEYFVLFQSP